MLSLSIDIGDKTVIRHRDRAFATVTKIAVFPVLNRVDEHLRVLHTKPHRDAFRLHRYIMSQQALVHLPSRVTNGQHNVIGWDHLPVSKDDPTHSSFSTGAIDGNIHYCGVE